MRLHAWLLAVGIVLGASAARAQEGTPSGATPSSEGKAAVHLSKAPKLVHFEQARFPAGETHGSTVVLALTIGRDGVVQKADVLQSGGAAFDAAAQHAALRFVFEPAEIDGRPAAVKIRYAYSFTPAALPVAPPPTPPHAPAPSPPLAPAPAHAPTLAPTPVPAPAPEAVTVRGAPRRPGVTDVTVSAEQASKVAGTQGDPIKVLENLPGLARPSFGSGALIVWGASPGETRTLVDGVEVPALFHGSALRSTINGDLVKSVTLTPGAYGSDYGRAIGSIVRVETKDLPETGVHGYAGADTLDGSAMATATVGDRVRVGVAGRYGWLDRVLQAVDAPNVDQYFAIPRYADGQVKMQVALRPRESLDLVLLESTDALSEVIPDADPARVRSETTSSGFQRFYLHYRRLLDDGGYVDVVPYFGRDESTLDAHFGENPATLDEYTRRYGVRASHRAPVTPWAALVVGADVDGSSAQVFRSGSLLIPPREGDVSVFGQPPGGDTATDAWTAGVLDVAPYVSAEFKVGPLAVTPGLRFDGYLLQTSRQTPRVGQTPSVGFAQLDAQLEPRISARLAVTRDLSILGAAGVYSQPPDPADLSAVFGNPKLGPETADHATLGESLRITQTLSLETVGFYKWIANLAVRDPSPTPKLTEALLTEGVGRAYGLQLLLRQQPWHGFFGWAAYTISRSMRQDTPGAGWRLFDYDQPHTLTIVASKELGAWTVGTRFRFATGLPRTPVLGAFYDAKDDVYQPVFGAQNSIRLPSFWQLDLRVDRSFAFGDGGRVLVYVEGLNVTNRANGEEYVYSVDYTQRGTVTGLPIVAVVGARVDL
jgi:TonB family protein